MALLNYPEKLSYSDYLSTAKLLEWAPTTIGVVFSEIEKDYLRIDADIYVKL